MNTHILCSYQKCSILCAPAPPLCAFFNHVITGPASLVEQIGPEHGCSLLLLVPLLQPDTSVPLCSTSGSLPLSTLDVGYKEAACGR